MKRPRSLLRNVAMLSLATYVELGLGLVLGVVVARTLGAGDFGHYAFAIWTCGMLITLGNNALTTSAIKFVAEARGAGNEDAAGALHHTLSRWQSISSAIVMSAFALIAFLHPPAEWRDALWPMVGLVVIGSWSRSGYMMMASLAKGNERFEVESASLVLSALVNLVLVMVTAYLDGDLIHFLAIYAACGLVQNLTARFALRCLHIGPRPIPLQPALVARLRRHLLQTGALVIVGLLGDRTFEVLLLKAYSTSEAVGFFAIAGALTKGATYLLAGALSSVLLPTMSRAFGAGGTSSVVRILQEAMRFYWFIGVAIAGLGIVFAPGAVRLLYGPEYEAAIPAVMVNLLVSGLVLVAAAFNAFQTSSDHQGDRIRIVALTLGVNLLAALALVPQFGLPGALGSLAITKVASVFFSWRYTQSVERIALPLSAMTRILAAAVVATAVAATVELVTIWRFAFLVAGPVFLATYACASIFLRAWTREDYELVAGIADRLGRRGGGIAALTRRLQKYFSSGPRRNRARRREVATDVLEALRLTCVLGSIRSSVVKDLRVLAYHRVLPELDERTYQFDLELVSARQAEFDWQMAYVARRFQPVTCRQVVAAIYSGVPLPKRAVMVTFDDGFRDNYDVAFPTLQRHGLPAVFFLTSGYISTADIFWFDWLVHVLLRADVQTIRLDALDLNLEIGPTVPERRAAALQLLRALKVSPESSRASALRQLEETARIEVTPVDRQKSATMTWEQIREMAAAGMEFGSHTVSHPILSTISDPEHLRQELDDSKSSIERETGRPVLALAYPVGGSGAVNAGVIEAVLASGYRMAFSYEPGTNRLPVACPLMLKRIQVERYTSRSMFAAALELPEIFAK